MTKALAPARITFSLLLLVPLLTSCGIFGSTNNEIDELARIRVNGELRTYQLHVPASYDEAQPMPLVIAFHGSNDSGQNFQRGSEFDKEADRLGFITAYPDSKVGNWAEGCDCNNADRLKVDDIGLTQAIIDTLSARFTVDRNRVYAIGFSQGGLYVQRLACEMSDQFAAIAGVAATFSKPLSEKCDPTSPISMLIMHGTEDTVLPWAGSNNGALSLLSADAAILEWVGHNECDTRSSSSTDHIKPGLSLKHRVYDQCKDNKEVHLYAVEGGGHAWPTGDIDAKQIIADFFAKQSKR